ncbi:unnamed protein product [Prunus armeniaca]
MGRGTLRPRGDLTTVSSAVSFMAFGFGLQYCGREAERILPLQLFFCFQEGEMPNETAQTLPPHPWILRSRPGQRPNGFQGMDPWHSS